MKPKIAILLTCVSLVALVGLTTAFARGRNSNVSGVWDCHSKGGNLGDMTFTLNLQQDKENVDGTITSPLGSTQVTLGTFKHYQLELHFDMPQGNYTLVGTLENGKIYGTWSMDSDKGAWDAVRHTATGH